MSNRETEVREKVFLTLKNVTQRFRPRSFRRAHRLVFEGIAAKDILTSFREKSEKKSVPALISLFPHDILAQNSNPNLNQ